MEFFLADMCKSVLNVLNSPPYQNTKALISINFEQMSTCRICRQPLYLSVYSLYRYKYKQWHSILARNLNITSRFCDILLIFEIVRNKSVSPKIFLKVTIQGFDMKPRMMYCLQFHT